MRRPQVRIRTLAVLVLISALVLVVVLQQWRLMVAQAELQRLRMLRDVERQRAEMAIGRFTRQFQIKAASAPTDQNKPAQGK